MAIFDHHSALANHSYCTHSQSRYFQSVTHFNHFIIHTLDEQFLNEKHAFWPSGYKDCRSSLQWCVHRSPLSEESLADRRSEGNLKTCRGTFNGKRRGSDTTWSNNRCKWEGWWSLKFRRTENQKSGFSIPKTVTWMIWGYPHDLGNLQMKLKISHSHEVEFCTSPPMGSCRRCAPKTSPLGSFHPRPQALPWKFAKHNSVDLKDLQAELYRVAMIHLQWINWLVVLTILKNNISQWKGLSI